MTYAGTLCVACKSGSSVGMWYALFDGTSWLAQDIGITTDGTVKTGHGPALAAMNPCLVMVYRDDRQAI